MSQRTPRTHTARPSLALLAAVLLAAGALAHPGVHPTGEIPISAPALAQFQADLAVDPTPRPCEVDGTLLAVTPDPEPLVSGLAGVINVSGMMIRVPLGVPVQLGDTPGDEILFSDLLATPDGFPNFIGRGVSAVATIGIETPPGEDPHLTCTADLLLVEAGHPPFIGIVTDNGPDGLFIMGVRIVPYADPRIAPFVRIHDLAGRPVPIDEIPVGLLVGVNGDHDPATNSIEALTIEIDGLLPPGPGENDHVSIERAEARTARLELRARGFSNNATTTISLYDFSAGTKGVLLAANIPVDPVDGAWDARFDFARVPTTPDGIPTRLLAETLNGGIFTADVLRK